MTQFKFRLNKPRFRQDVGHFQHGEFIDFELPEESKDQLFEEIVGSPPSNLNTIEKLANKLNSMGGIVSGSTNVLRTVDLDGNGDHLTIQDAINNASVGEVIHVNPGVYNENLIIDKCIIVSGESTFACRLNGSVTITSDSTFVMGIQNLTQLSYHQPCYNIMLQDPDNAHVIIHNMESFSIWTGAITDSQSVLRLNGGEVFILGNNTLNNIRLSSDPIIQETSFYEMYGTQYSGIISLSNQHYVKTLDSQCDVVVLKSSNTNPKSRVCLKNGHFDIRLLGTEHDNNITLINCDGSGTTAASDSNQFIIRTNKVTGSPKVYTSKIQNSISKSHVLFTNSKIYYDNINDSDVYIGSIDNHDDKIDIISCFYNTTDDVFPKVVGDVHYFVFNGYGRYSSSDNKTVTPPSPKIGDTYYDTTLGKPLWYDGTLWRESVFGVNSAEVDLKINTAISTLKDNAILDTLNKLSIAVNNDPSYYNNIQTSLNNKVDKITGKQLSTEDYTTAEKSKLNMLTPDDLEHRRVTDVQILLWNDKVDKIVGKQLSTEDYTTTEKTKLNGLTNYSHPSNHNADIIIQDSNNRFVTDTQISLWDNKATTDMLDTKVDKIVGKQLSTEDYTTIEKNKLNGLVNYVHPSNHNADIILQDSDNRFVTDTQMTSWDNKVDKILGKQLSTEDYTTTEKTKLSTLANYSHPANHDADIILQDSDNRFVTDTQIASWNNKASNDMLDTKVDKIVGKQLSTEDYTTEEKNKLNGLTNYVHPSNHDPSVITQDSNNRFVTDIQITSWDSKPTITDVDSRINTIIGSAPDTLDQLNEIATALGNDPNFATTIMTELGTKVDKVIGKQLSTEDYTTTEKTKLLTLANYSHPANHNADIIIQDSNNRFVTDTQVTSWDNKVDSIIGKQLSTEDYTTTEKTKLNGLVNYSHPANHDPSIIIQDSNNRFVTDNQISLWNDKVDSIVGKQLSTEDYTTIEKTKLSTLVNYSHPANHEPSIITQDGNNRFVTDIQVTSWNNKVDSIVGKQLSTEDYTTEEKTKLSSLVNYTHPSNHDPSIILQDSNNRFVTDTQITSWDNKVDSVVGKQLSTEDYTTTEKSKLSTLVNYTHPSNHDPSIILQDSNNRFVTDTQVTSWDSKPTTSDVQTIINNSIKVGFSVCVFNSATSVVVGAGKEYFVIPQIWNGYFLRDIIGVLHTSGSGTGTTTVQIRKNTTQVLSIPLTFSTIGVQATHNDNIVVNTGDKIFVDVLSVTSTKPKGLTIAITIYGV